MGKDNKKHKSNRKKVADNVANSKINGLDNISQLTEEQLRLALITTQYALRETRQKSTTAEPDIESVGLLVLVNGMELSAKGKAVTQLRQWIDPRLLKVEATLGTPSFANQPVWQAHTKMLPRHGDVTVYFGNWYADVIQTAISLMTKTLTQTLPNQQGQQQGQQQQTEQQHIDNSQQAAQKSSQQNTEQPVEQAWQTYLTTQLNKLKQFEADLANNQTHLLKCWFYIDADTLKSRLNDAIDDPMQLYHMDWSNTQMLSQFNQIAEQLLSQQDDWVMINGNDETQACQTFTHHVLQAMQTAVAHSEQLVKPNREEGFIWADIPDKLIDIDDADLNKQHYKKQLLQKQQRLAHLIRQRGNRHVLFAFEGMDAAGKGGAIKRLVAPLDPREYEIHNIAAPMQYELEHPYLWRFWTRLPKETHRGMSRVAIFDRTWYGRVLVERVESFTNDHEWQRAYAEINRFEQDLTDAGAIVIKFWLAIDKKEQLERFEDRQETPHKQFKITKEDWRNRDKWKQYVQAASDMLARTNTTTAPWHVVASNDKRTARLMVLDYAIEQLERMLLGAHEQDF